MTSSWKHLLSAALLLAPAVRADAVPSLTPVKMPDRFLVDSAPFGAPPLLETPGSKPMRVAQATSMPPTIERTQAATATLNSNFYNVIGPTFNGSDGNQSFIRLGNGGAATTTFTITVVGSPSGTVYGTGQVQVPPSASPQYSLSTILTTTGAGPLANNDTSYSLYIQDPDSALSFQHVIFNGSNLFFENVSECHFAPTGDYSGLNGKLANVHTTVLSGYPAQIYIHNYAKAAATYNVSIYDNNTGTLIGTVPLTLQANSTYATPFSWFQQQLNWTPSSTQQHANMSFSPVSPATFQIELGDYIYNQQLQAYVNMSQRCPFTASSPTATSFQGTIAGNDGVQSGTLAVTVQTTVASTAAPIAQAQSAPEKQQATYSASGTLSVSGGGNVTLSGTYDSTTNTVTASGGGYSFTGSIASGAYTGTYTGPSATSGGFASLQGSKNSVTAYCGTATATTTNGTRNGVWNLQVSASGALNGSGTPGLCGGSGGNDGAFSGTVTNGSVSGSSASGNTFSATVTGSSVSGTIQCLNPNHPGSGTFSGASCTLP
jgi:hypothetical protein